MVRGPTPRARSTESTAAPWRAVQPHRRAPRNPRTLHGVRSSSTGAVHGIHGRSMVRGPTPRAVHGIHGRRARRPFRRFRRRRLPEQAALLRRLPQRPVPRRRRLSQQATPRRRLSQRPALPVAAPPETGGASAAAFVRPALPAAAPPAAASPETGGASAAAFAAAGASGGGASRNRRRFCGGFRSGRRFRRFRRRRLPKQAALLRRLPQRSALSAAASPEKGGARCRLPQRPALPAAAPPETGVVSTTSPAAAGAFVRHAGPHTRFSGVRECRRRAGFTTPAFSRAAAARSPSICGTAVRSPAHGQGRTPPPEAARVPHPGPAGPCRAAPS